MLEFLTEDLHAALRYVNLNLVYELRIRANKPVVVNYGGKYMFLGPKGVTENIGSAVRSSYAEIEKIIYRASEFSVYSVTEQLRQGFLTGANGERIGLAGIFVYENGSAFTVKEVTSLNIRVPHEVRGCGEYIFSQCFSKGLRNILIVSPPGRGKTTILRDLTRLVSARYLINVLVNDERNEICAQYRDFSLDTGAFTDVIRYSYKRDALVSAVRAMRPDLIVTDELIGEEEVAALADCVRSGVNVVASAHFKDIPSLKNSAPFARAVKEKIFDYYVVLDAGRVGKVSGIYGQDFSCVGGGEC